MLPTRRSATALGIALALGSSAAPSRAADLIYQQSRFSAVYVKTLRSLVLLQTRGRDGTSAFCTGTIVASDSRQSVVLTAAHCVEDGIAFRVVLRNDVRNPVVANVIRSGSKRTNDVALLSVGVPNLPVMPVAERTEPGAVIAVIGYPKISLDMAGNTGELVPTIHEGTVSAVRQQQHRVEYSAVTDHGNSGGPVVDTESGELVAVVSGGYDESVYKDVNVGSGPATIRELGNAASVAFSGAHPAARIPAAPTVGSLGSPRLGAPSGSGTSGMIPVAVTTDPGPSTLSWSAYTAATPLKAIPGVFKAARCMPIGPAFVWQVDVANTTATPIAFDHRLTDAQGRAKDPPYHHVIANDDVYEFVPQVLDVACTSSAYHNVTNVQRTGTARPVRASVAELAGRAVDQPWSVFTQPAPLGPRPTVTFRTRCTKLGKWQAYQLAFNNGGSGPVAFDVDLEVKGSSANMRRRLAIPLAGGTYYTEPFVFTNAPCGTTTMTLWTANIADSAA